MVGDGVEPSLGKLGLDLVGIPGFDAPGESVEDRVDGRPADTESGVRWLIDEMRGGDR